MTAEIPESPPRRTAHFVSNTGCLRNEHFLLSTDHLMLEVDQQNFELVSAHAEGSIELHMLSPDEGQEYVAFADSAIYRPAMKRITLVGWKGARHNGVLYPPSGIRRNIALPTDGTFYNTNNTSVSGLAEVAA